MHHRNRTDECCCRCWRRESNDTTHRRRYIDEGCDEQKACQYEAFDCESIASIAIAIRYDDDDDDLISVFQNLAEVAVAFDVQWYRCSVSNRISASS